MNGNEAVFGSENVKVGLCYANDKVLLCRFAVSLGSRDDLVGAAHPDDLVPAKYRLPQRELPVRLIGLGPDRKRNGHHADESLLLVVNGDTGQVDVRLPAEAWAGSYRLLWDSAQERPPAPGSPVVEVPGGGKIAVTPLSLRVYGARRGPDGRQRSHRPT